VQARLACGNGGAGGPGLSPRILGQGGRSHAPPHRQSAPPI
jgi:hypothetical protein